MKIKTIRTEDELQESLLTLGNDFKVITTVFNPTTDSLDIYYMNNKVNNESYILSLPWSLLASLPHLKPLLEEVSLHQEQMTKTIQKIGVVIRIDKGPKPNGHSYNFNVI